MGPKINGLNMAELVAKEVSRQLVLNMKKTEEQLLVSKHAPLILIFIPSVQFVVKRMMLQSTLATQHLVLSTLTMTVDPSSQNHPSHLVLYLVL